VSERSARGFVLDRRPFREHDLRAELLLEDGDRVEVLAPSGQRSKQRFAGGLTPLALHRFAMTPSTKGIRLDEARIERTWAPLHNDLTRQTVALTATGFLRELAAPAPGDATYFLLLGELYERVSLEPEPKRSPARLVRFVLEVLTHGGHAPVLDRCVRCETPAPERALVTVDPEAGGVVCLACGGGPYRLRSADRAALRAVSADDASAYTPGMVTTLASIVRGATPEGAALLAKADEVLSRVITPGR
jgi:DNA repair protein RecO (recombination protein O)